MQAIGKRVDLESESICEFALVFSRTIARLEQWLVDK